MEHLTAEDFTPFLHTIFTIRMGDGSAYPLELVEVAFDSEAPQPGLRRPFSLLFRNPRRDAFLPQRIYSLEYPRPATSEQPAALEIFLVPLGPDAAGMQYQAIFS